MLSLRCIHEYIHEFSNSDISRVKGFCPIPQQSVRGERRGRGEEAEEGATTSALGREMAVVPR
jgi:hypothetical protein